MRTTYRPVTGPTAPMDAEAGESEPAAVMHERVEIAVGRGIGTLAG